MPLKKSHILLVLTFAFVSSVVALLLANGDVEGEDLSTSDPIYLERGGYLFNQNCGSCHALQENGIGPPLGGINSVLSDEELITFIQNPSAVIASGDKRANFLLDRYNSEMPGFSYLKQEEIENILDYIEHESATNHITAKPINLDQAKNKKERYADSITFDGLVVEIEDYIRVPIDSKRSRKKGIATLRTTPSKPQTLFISDQMGKIYTSHNGNIKLFLDLASRFSKFKTEPGHGTGLGSFAIHPDYDKNGLFYTTHAEEYLGKRAINAVPIPSSVGVWLQWVLTEWKMDDPDDSIFSGTQREVLRIDPLTHAHGVQDINFNPYLSEDDPDYGLLHIGVGDGGAINRGYPELANQKRSPLGAILRIDPLGTGSPNGNYGIPVNNPFCGEDDPSVQKEIFAYGFRNPHRFCWDRETGTMLAADVGESNVEEVNIVESGKHYGWNILEGSYGIDTQEDAKTLFRAKVKALALYELPFAAYDHQEGNAISGGFVYYGTIKALKGKYIFGDIAKGRIFYIDIDKNFKDNTIHEIKLYYHDEETSLRTLLDVRNANLRVAYDENNEELFLMTKEDASIRKVVDAYYIEDQNKLIQ